MEKKWYIISVVARLGFLAYGVWQDCTMTVKFTDVDYYVFTDAAEFVTKGQSPFLRSTYRYTPLLAWVLTMNIWLSPVIGKLAFITFDILVGQLLHQILHKLGYSADTCKNAALIWLLNPLCATVSSRGNAESVVAWLVLMSLSMLLQGRTAVSAVFYALSVHFKIYPITFALPIYLYLGNDQAKVSDNSVMLNKNKRGNSRMTRADENPSPCLSNSIRRLLPNQERIVFMSVGALVLGSLTAVFYWMYGWLFLYETYIYHIVRGDIRHNFSPYFYLLYLTSSPENGVPLCLRLLVFVPQAVILLYMSFKFYKRPALCWFLCVFVFVAFNKVCTSQYFLWYLSLLPLIVPDLNVNVSGLVWMLALWLAGQGVWLLPAYLLEFEGLGTYLYLWVASLLFLSINAFIVHRIVTSYKPRNKGCKQL